MDESTNYTPLDTEKLSPQKKSFKMSNKVLVGLILFFTIGVGTVGFLLTRESLQTQVPAQVDTTLTATPAPSPTGEIPTTESPAPTGGEPTVPVATEAALTTETLPTPTETETPTPTLEPENTKTPTPTEEPAGIGGYNDEPTATPTEIILVEPTAVSEEAGEEQATQPPEIPSAGIATFSTIFAVVSVAVIFLGLIL